MARKVFIAGNWKMNKTAAETVELCKALKEKFADVCPSCVDVAVCPPFTSIAAAIAELKGSNIKVGAQNIHWADNGAFTGEISGAMLKEMGVEYVIIGHSERRQYFGNEDIEGSVSRYEKTAPGADSRKHNESHSRGQTFFYLVIGDSSVPFSKRTAAAVSGTV